MDDLIKKSLDIVKKYDDLIKQWWTDGEILNIAIRNNNLSEEQIIFKKNLINFLNEINTNNDIIVYRGIKHKVSDNFTTECFTSTTTDIGMAERFSKDMNILTILIPKGSYCFYISALNIAEEFNEYLEYEILLPPGTFKFSKDMNCWIYNN